MPVFPLELKYSQDNPQGKKGIIYIELAAALQLFDYIADTFGSQAVSGLPGTGQAVYQLGTFPVSVLQGDQ